MDTFIKMPTTSSVPVHRASQDLEQEILLACARTTLTAAQKDNLQALFRQSVDWSRLIQMASGHAVMPLVCWHIKALAADIIPPDLLPQLQNYLLENTRHNFLLTREMVKVLKLFEEHRIQLIPFKGPALAATIYGNLTLRQFGDIDVLVHKRDIQQAKALLLANGYREIVALTTEQEKDHLRDDYVYNLVREDGKVVLELHWAINANCMPFPLDVDELSKRLQPVAVAGTSLPNIAPEELLLILCVHGTKHIWGRLGWICDVAELIRAAPQLNWPAVLKQAQQLNSRRSACLGLLLAQQVLGASLPESVTAEIRRDREAVALAQQVQARLFQEENPTSVVDSVFLIRTIEHFPDRFRYAMHLVATPNAEQRSTLPGFLSFLWFVIRPVGLVGKYALAPFSRAAKR